MNFLCKCLTLYRYWHRTTLMREDTLVKKTLNLVTNNGQDSHEWLATVKLHLKLLHLEEYILDPTFISTGQFTTLCLNKIKHTSIEQWKTSISNSGQSGKFRFYSEIKRDNVNKLLNKSNIPIISTILYNNKFITRYAEKANLFNEYCLKRCKTLMNDSILPPYLITDKQLVDIEFTVEYLKNTIHPLDRGKKSIRMLLICGDPILVLLDLIFPNIIQTGIYPQNENMQM